MLWIFTGGLLGIGSLIDLFTLGGKIDAYNMERELRQTTDLLNQQVRTNAGGVTVNINGNSQSGQPQNLPEKQQE